MRVYLPLLLVVACAAPQQAGGERTAYLAMATASGGTLGAIGGGIGCHLVRYGISHGPSTTDGKDQACVAVGALVGGAASLYGSIASEAEADGARWVGVSLGTAAFAVIVVHWVTQALR